LATDSTTVCNLSSGMCDRSPLLIFSWYWFNSSRNSEEGEDATKSKYVERINEIRAVSDPIALRVKETGRRC
jgi:hypothetical protein